MTETRSTKRALLASVVALMLCIAMLLGTTYAWFTDSVTSGRNMIQSGNLDIELEYATPDNRDAEGNLVWAPVTEDTAIFDDAALWEPGYTEAVALRVRNAGTLAAKYELSTNVYLEKEGTNVYDETFKLSNYLDVYYSPAQQNDQIGEIMTELMMGSRDKALGNGMAVTEGELGQAYVEDAVILAGDEFVTVVTVTMPTTVGNEANYKTGTEAPYIQFGINLLATQAQVESDSFGTDYDKNAKYANVPKADITYNANNVGKDLVWNTSWGVQTEPQLDTAYTFKLTESLDEIQNSEYANWHADFVITADDTIVAGDTGIAGSYGSWNWIGFSTADLGELPKDTPLRLLNSFSSDLFVNCEELSTMVGGVFDCGVWNNCEANNGKTITVELRLYETKDPADTATNTTNEETGNYVTVASIQYTME